MSKMTRREFLKLIEKAIGALGLTAIFGSVVAFFYPPKLQEVPSEPVKICPESELPVNESKLVKYGRYPALVIKTPTGLRAYSAICTHFACIVKWEPAKGKIYCPCHDGYFDPLDGHVLAGPPPTPLQTLPIRVVDGDIYVGGDA